MITVINLLLYSTLLVIVKTGETIYPEIENKSLTIIQLTYTAKNHELDNNDNFSYDDKYLCYDTRGTLGYGIENCISIEVVNITTGKEMKVYQPEKVRLGRKPAPGVGAVSFHPQEYSLVFIHGPEIQYLNNSIQNEEIYSKSNRRGCIVSLGQHEKISRKGWVDLRVISCETDFPSGVHRGGSHRHEFSMDGKKIGCTYDDYLLPQYGRTVGYFEKTEQFLPNAEYYFAILVKVVPPEKAEEGDFIKALGDSWIDSEGKQRVFIGTVKEGNNFVDYLCVVEIPESINIQTSNSGNCEEYPEPPKGLSIYKIIRVDCSGIVRSSPDEKKIAYLNKDRNGKTQIFMVTADKSKDRDIFKDCIPVQVTFLPDGVEDNLRWHPSGNTIFSISEGAVISVCVKEGENFGKAVFITPKYRVNKPYALVVSRKGEYVAFNRHVPTYDERGMRLFSSEGKDFSQIFLLKYKDNDMDGLPDTE